MAYPHRPITITITIKILLLQLYASCETALRHPSCPRRKLRIVPSEKQKTSSRAAAHGKAQPHPQHGTKTRETQLHPRSPNHPEGASKHANDQASPQPKATPPHNQAPLHREKPDPLLAAPLENPPHQSSATRHLRLTGSERTRTHTCNTH